MDVPVLFEDDDVIAVDKPPGILSIPDRYDADAPNLATTLKDALGDIFVCHRLDRDTSGVMLFAKTAAAHKSLNEQFELHTVRKRYEAIVIGILKDERGTIDLPIGPHRKHKGLMQVDAVHGKAAVTHYSRVAQFRDYAHVSVELETGRQHQIRVHFAAIEHPLMVDPQYAHAEEFFLSSIKKHYRGTEEERPMIARLTLHAAELEFTHPMAGTRVTVRSPLPKDMAAVLRQLAKWNA